MNNLNEIQNKLLNNKENMDIENIKPNEPQASKFSFSSKPNLEEIRKELEKFCSDRNWEQYHTPRNLLLALVGEVGELSEIFQWKGEVPVGLDSKWTPNEREHLEQELSDCFIYLVRLAQVCNVDLPKAVSEKMEMNSKKYPINKFYGSSKKYNE